MDGSVIGQIIGYAFTAIGAGGATWLWHHQRNEGKKTQIDKLDARLTKHEEDCAEASRRNVEMMQAVRDTIGDLKATLSELRGVVTMLMKKD